MKVIPYGRQYIDNTDILSVAHSLKQDLITTGAYVKKFENKINQLVSSKYAISCSSGTSGLHLALLAIDLKSNDVVIMPAINFIASYGMAKKMNAKIYLADVDPLSGQMTPETLNNCINKNKLKKIKAIITMPMGGYPENIEEFFKIKSLFKCRLIEDACHAMGAQYSVKNFFYYTGSCKHSDIAVFSLHPLKTITSGEGGIVTTNNKIFYKKMISFRSHGIQRKDATHWKYNIVKLGYNYRLSDLNCALALSQLKKITKFIKNRKKIYQNYTVGLKKFKNIFKFYEYDKKNKPSYHLSLISINFKKNGSNKQKLISFLNKHKIICQYHYIPIYKLKIYKKKINKKYFQGAEYYYKNSLSLPIFYSLNSSMQKKILSKIIQFFKLK
tara:strand:- start:32308 stop:33465 length:1158 start_codon:yes stop_codon:yes gene_type:complete